MLLLAASVAAGLGILAGTTPPETILIVFGAAGLIMCSVVSPIAAISALVIFAPIRALLLTEASFSLPLDISQMLLLLLLGAWGATRISQTHRIVLPKLTPTAMALTFFLATSAISAFGAYSVSAWLTEWLKWAMMLALVLLVAEIGAGRRWEYVIFAVTAAAASNAVIGVYIFLGGSGADHLRINDRFFRAIGTFGQPNPFGGFMGLIAPIAIAMFIGHCLSLWRHFRQNRRIPVATMIIVAYYTVTACLISIGVLVSWSRGAWLAFVVALTAMAVALPRRWSMSAGLALSAATVLFLIWQSGTIPSSIDARIRSATDELTTVEDVRGVDITTENYAIIERLAHWQAGLNMIAAHPFAGVGFGNYEIAYDNYRLINWDEPLGHAHNYYLNVFAETGIIGATGYVFLWVIIIIRTWSARSHPDDLTRVVAAGLMGTWAYLSVHSLTDNLYVNNLFLHIGVLLGVLGVIDEQSHRSYRVTWHEFFSR